QLMAVLQLQQDRDACSNRKASHLNSRAAENVREVCSNAQWSKLDQHSLAAGKYPGPIPSQNSFRQRSTRVRDLELRRQQSLTPKQCFDLSVLRAVRRRDLSQSTCKLSAQ